MSDTRSSNSIIKEKKPCHVDTEFVNNAKTYATTTMLTYILGKLEYTYHTFSQTASPSIKQITNIAWQTKFKGLGFNISYNFLSSLVMLSAKNKIEKCLDKLNSDSSMNKQLAAFAGGSMGLVVTYPLIMAEALRFEGASLSKIMDMKAKHLYRGLPAMSLSEGVFCAVYFTIQPKLSDYLVKKINIPKNKADYYADAATGIIGMISSNPFYVISSCQKTSNKTMHEEALSLYKKGGVKRFFPGLLTLGILSSPLYAISLGSSSRCSEKYDEYRRSFFSS